MQLTYIKHSLKIREDATYTLALGFHKQLKMQQVHPTTTQAELQDSLWL